MHPFWRAWRSAGALSLTALSLTAQLVLFTGCAPAVPVSKPKAEHPSIPATGTAASTTAPTFTPRLFSGNLATCRIDAPGEIQCWGEGVPNELIALVKRKKGVRVAFAAPFYPSCVVNAAGSAMCTQGCENRVCPLVTDNIRQVKELWGGGFNHVLQLQDGSVCVVDNTHVRCGSPVYVELGDPASKQGGARGEGPARKFDLGAAVGRYGQGPLMPGNRECFMRGAPTEPSAEVGVESIELACRRLERSTATGVPITTQTSRVALDAERNVWRVGATVVMEPLPGFGKVDAVASTNDVSCAHSARGPLSCVYHPEPLERSSLGLSASAVAGVDCVEQMVSGWDHLCVQTCEGQTLCFGSNLEGQLGQPKPAELGTNFVDLQHVTQLSAGADHTCALTREGTVYCWGASDDARLSGDAQGRVYARPVQVPLPAAAKLVSSSSTRSCALLVDGQAYCWGLDYHGPVFVELPTRVPGIDSAQQLEPGINHSCALVDGEVWCWGETVYPERANWQPLEPTRIAGIADAIQISVGNEHACALDRHGSTRCWGRLRFAKEDRVAGPTLFPLLPKAVQLRARSEGACARTADGEVHCAWGPEQKARQIDVGMAIDLIGLEQSKLCAITQELQVRCADNLGPQNLTDLGAVRQVAVGKGHVCALRTDGRVQCVGANHRGQLGAGELLFSLHPVEVTLPSRGRSLQ